MVHSFSFDTVMFLSGLVFLLTLGLNWMTQHNTKAQQAQAQHNTSALLCSLTCSAVLNNTPLHHAANILCCPNFLVCQVRECMLKNCSRDFSLFFIICYQPLSTLQTKLSRFCPSLLQEDHRTACEGVSWHPEEHSCSPPSGLQCSAQVSL